MSEFVQRMNAARNAPTAQPRGMLLRGILEAKHPQAQSRALLLVQPPRLHAPGSTNSTDSMFNLAPTLDSHCFSTAIATEPHLTTGGMAAEVFITP